MAFHVDRLSAFERVAVWVRRPTTMVVDEDGRPHAERSPALAWSGGSAGYAWRGRTVPADTVDRNPPITPSPINRETDPERRRVLIERYGLSRHLLVSGLSETDRDNCGRLYRLAGLHSEPIVAGRALDRTHEPDGISREFRWSVPPTTMTARHAVAWTFDLPPKRIRAPGTVLKKVNNLQDSSS